MKVYLSGKAEYLFTPFDEETTEGGALELARGEVILPLFEEDLLL